MWPKRTCAVTSRLRPYLPRLRPLPAFLTGCILGCLLSTSLYMWVSGGLRSSNSDYYNAGIFSTQWSSHYNYKLTPENLMMYLRTIGSLGSPIEKQLGRPWSLVTEFRKRKSLLAVVLTSWDKLETTAKIVNETWGQVITEYKIVVAGNRNMTTFTRTDEMNSWHIPISVMWKCEDFEEDGSTLNQTFQLLRFLHYHYKEHYDWFLLLQDNVYVAATDMEMMLKVLDPYRLVYMGKPGSTNPLDMANLRMITNEYFCESGPGVILSNAALKAIEPHLDECLELVHTYSLENGIVLDRADAELGRCFSRRLGITCSTSQEALNFFIYDEKQESVRPERLWYNPHFQDLLTLYPIFDNGHMRAVHHFIKAREFHRFQRKLKTAQEQVNSICHTVSTRYLPPFTEPDIRDCNLQAYNTCNTHPPITLDMLPYSFTPASKPELGLWEFLDPRSHYTIGTTYPVQSIVGENLEELQYVISKAVNKLNNQEAKEYTFQKVLSGYMRYSGSRGREYILDLLLADKFSSVHRRVNLLRVAQPEIVFFPDSLEDKMEEKVNIILPLSHVSERFNEFLLDYEDLYLKPGENTRLVLSVFGSEDLEFVQTQIHSLREKYPEADFEVVVGNQQFTRARALHLGLSILNNSEIAFLCDVDMSIEPGFLNRCRMNPIQGKRIYYPVFFKYYNMDYVYRFRRKPVTYRIQREHGHWAEYSFGMVCLYKSDYIASGGFDLAIVGWGGEDVDLFNKLLNTKIEILKSPDPALSHRYHDKTCSRKLNPLQFSMCISSRNEGLADRMQLAEYVLYLEDRYGLTHRSLWNS